jgi:hypothetical protein
MPNSIQQTNHHVKTYLQKNDFEKYPTLFIFTSPFSKRLTFLNFFVGPSPLSRLFLGYDYSKHMFFAVAEDHHSPIIAAHHLILPTLNMSVNDHVPIITHFSQIYGGFLLFPVFGTSEPTRPPFFAHTGCYFIYLRIRPPPRKGAALSDTLSHIQAGHRI